MGLMDILNGMQNGPRGQPNPAGGGGMSPITMAILGLLAYKAIKGFSGGQASANQVNPNPNANTAPNSGGLGGLFGGGLGGLLAGGAAGSVLSGGLNDLLRQFQQNGHGDAANSWVGTGANKSISPDQMAEALGADKIDDLMAQTGMSRDELLQGLSDHLPGVVDQLTPHGRLPSEGEASQWV